MKINANKSTWLKAYRTALPNGDMKIDVERMMVDLVSVAKMDRKELPELLEAISAVWPQVDISVKRPTDH